MIICRPSYSWEKNSKLKNDYLLEKQLEFQEMWTRTSSFEAVSDSFSTGNSDSFGRNSDHFGGNSESLGGNSNNFGNFLDIIQFRELETAAQRAKLRLPIPPFDNTGTIDIPKDSVKSAPKIHISAPSGRCHFEL